MYLQLLIPRVWVFSSAALALSISYAPKPEPTRAAYEATLAEVQSLLQREKWKSARSTLLKAIDEHADREYVVYHWNEAEECLARASFWMDWKAPEPQDVVAGELIRYKPKTGDIKLRYGPGRGLAGQDKGGDFYDIDGWLVHPMLFKGPYNIELQATDALRSELPAVHVGFDWNKSYGAVFGKYSALFEFDGDDARELDLVSTSIGNKGRNVFKVSLGTSHVTAFHNGKRLMRSKRPKGDFGQLYFEGSEGIEEVTITGEVEPSWIAGRIDYHNQRGWLSFRDAFDVSDLIPAWLARHVDRVPLTAGRFGDVGPAPSSSVEVQALIDAKSAVRSGELVSSADYKPKHDNLSESTRAWIGAVLDARLGSLDSSLELCESVIAADPSFLQARILRATLIRVTRSAAEAETEYEGLIEEYPLYADPYIGLARLRFELGEFDAIQPIVERGVAAGVGVRAFDTVELNRLRELHGPAFGETDSYSSKNFEVISDMGESICYTVAEELEKHLRRHMVNVLRLPRIKKRFRVYLFSGLSGYEVYCQDLFGDTPESELGRYSPSLKQLLIWNSEDRRLMMRTVRHEGFHQYLDRLSSEAPVWLHEGMAEYIEEAGMKNGRWAEGKINDGHLRNLRRTQKWSPLRELIYGHNAYFRANNELHYAQAWAWIHFLKHGKSKASERLTTLIEALADGAPRVEALDRAFGDADWTELEREFRSYVDSLK